jgi:hypothetical protein
MLRTSHARHPDRTLQLTVLPSTRAPRTSATVAASIVVPAIVADAGDQAARRFLEFLAATIRNRNTRAAYLHAIGRFFAWCEHHRISQLADIEPLHVAAYIEAFGGNLEKPTVKQHLAAIRMLFDWLVTGQVIATNPAHAVRSPKHVVKTGKTTVLGAGQARKLLDSIDTSTVVGLRDRALISVMTFALEPPTWRLVAHWKTPKPWRRTKAHAPPSTTTVRVIKSHSMKLSGSLFEETPG